MPVPVAIPLESVQPSGITSSLSFDNRLILARSSLVELYDYQNLDLVYIAATRLDSPVIQFYKIHQEILVVTMKSAYLLEIFSLKTVKTFVIQAPGEEEFQSTNRPMCAFIENQKILIVACGNFFNYINVIYLENDSETHDIHQFRAGQLVSIASYGEYLSILARQLPADPNVVLNSFANQRTSSLQIFSAAGGKLREVQKTLQLPFDAYAVKAAPLGFIIMCPRQFIFKRIAGVSDLRFRFSYLHEEVDPDIEYIQQVFERNFEQSMDFDFSNLVKGKIINHLTFNMQLENDQIHTIQQKRLPLAPRQLVPGHPVLDLQENFKFYGYNSEEISMKLNQVQNIIGDFPVCDFMLEAELRRYKDNNLHYIGILANIQNFIEIPPLYDVEIQFLDDNIALIVDNNGLMYSLHVFEEDVHMYPIIIADQDLSLRTDNRVHTISLLDTLDTDQSLFEYKTETIRKEFVLFVGSFTQDSYITRLQITKEVPDIDYYNDHRQREHTNPNYYRDILLDELKKNCSIINRKNEGQTKETIDTEIVEIGPSFFKKRVDQNILKKLYPQRYNLLACDQFEGANLFQVAVGERQQTLDSVDHCVIKFESVVPSLAGVVDSIIKPVSRKNTVGQLIMLNNTGVIQQLSTKLDFKNIQVIQNVESKIRTTHLLNFVQLNNEQESVIAVAQRSGNQLFRTFLTDGKHQIEPYNVFEINEVILDSFQVNQQETFLLTHKAFLHLNFQNQTKEQVDLTNDILIHGSINLNGYCCCTRQDLYLLNFQTKQQSKINLSVFQSLLDIEPSEIINETDSFMSSVSDIVSQETLKYIFGIDQTFLFVGFITLESSSVIIVGINFDLTLQVIYQFSQLKQSLPLPNFANISKQSSAHAFNTIVHPFFSSTKTGVNLYLVSAARGGSIYTYFYNKYTQKFTKIHGDDMPILQPPLNLTSFVDYDFWANKYTINGKDVFIRDSKPCERFIQEDTEIAVCTFPTPYRLSEPCALVIAPTVTGSVSFYDLGSPYSGLRFNGINLFSKLAYPPRSCMRFGDKIMGVFDSNEIYNSNDSKIAQSCSLGIFDIDFGDFQSSFLDLKFQRSASTNFIKYSSSLAQNSQNCRRNFIFMPFNAEKIIYHQKTNCLVVVGSCKRREIRTPRSMTLDEVANIRIFETVEDLERTTVPKEEIIENCHSLIQRDPPPVNSFQLISHQHLFLFNDNLLIDGTQLELQRLEHVNHVCSDLLFSNYPMRFGRYWQGHNIYMDKFGRMDRRNKNDDSDKRLEVLENYKLKEELREMLILCSNYTLGSFQKCYGKVQILAIDLVSAETIQKDEEIKSLSITQIEKDYQSRALRRNINTNFFVCEKSRIPCGKEHFQLNKIAFEELQNAVTAAVCAPSAKCVMIGESKHIKCYNLVDSQKLQLCAQWLGLGHVTSVARFQDYFLVSDATLEARLWVFKERGKRISDMSELSKNFAARLGNFFINQYNNLLNCSFIVENNLVLTNYRYSADKKEKRERLQSQQKISIKETPISNLKVPTFVPLPADQEVQSGLCNVVVTVEGSVIQVVPVPSDICVMAGVKECFLKPRNNLNAFDRDAHFACEVDFKWEEKLFLYEIQQIKSKVKSTAGAW